MADEVIRVLFRFTVGLPARQMSGEERSKMRDLYAQLREKWDSYGVRELGVWHGYGDAVDGFGHYMILEVDDVKKVRKMALDIQGGEIGRFVERYSLHIGWDMPAS
jgi:hypothetical protein